MEHLLIGLASPDFGLHPWWYLGRAGGFLAYSLLFLSMVLGIGVSSRVFDGLLARGWFFEMHKFLSLLVVAAVLFHVLVMLPDPFAGFTVGDVFVPFVADLRTLPLAVGIFSFYGAVLVAFSFYATKWIGQKTWRTLHYLAFLVYVGGAIHGVWAGTDTGLPVVRLFYLGTGMTLVFFVCYRLLALRNQKAPVKAVTPKSRISAVPASEGRVDERQTAAG